MSNERDPWNGGASAAEEAGADESDREGNFFSAGANTPPAGDERASARGEERAPGPRRDRTQRAETPVTEESAEQSSRSKNSCVIMGPSQVGKTMLLAAIQRACHQPGLDDFKLRFVAEGNTGSRLAKVAVEIIKQRQSNQPLATGAERKEQAEYPFWIHATGPKTRLGLQSKTRSANMVVNDGPGGALFPAENLALSADIEEWQKKLVRDGLEAESLILCVDSMRPSADLLESYLPDVIGKMSKLDRQNERVPFGERALSWIRRRPVDASRSYAGRWLKADRFLLLLTKIDLLCQNVHRFDPSFTPEGLARRINSVEQARSLLGVHLLNTIHDALKSDAKFAIGVTSAWGFSPISKEPFAGPDGLPGAAPGETGEDILPDWTPFGIRDAMYFITTGECRGSVRLVHPDDLGVRVPGDPQPRRLYPLPAGWDERKKGVL